MENDINLPPEQRELVKEDYIDCLAYGLIGVKDVSATADYVWFTGKLATATTAKQIAFTFFKRSKSYKLIMSQLPTYDNRYTSYYYFRSN